MIKKIFIIPLITLLIVFQSYALPKTVESIAATVNNNVILQTDVDSTLKGIKFSADPKNLPDDQTLKHQIIERLIVENLILQQASRARITVSDSELQQTIQQIASSNGVTVDQLREHLTKSGINFASYRNKIRNDMIIDRTRMNEVRKRITISDREVNNLVEIIQKQPKDNRDINISHILLATPENPTKKQLNDVTKKVQQILTRLQKGESFAKLAASYSSDELALKGGNMGWQKLNELPSLFESKLVQAKKGDIIGPLRSGVGFHILKVEDTRTKPIKTVSTTEFNAEHILIKTNVLVSDEIAKQKIDEIKSLIKEGSITFEDAAKKYSEDIGSAQNGGELGWNNPDVYDNSFKNALIKLKKGEISQPVKSAFGWHLIKLIDTKKIDQTEFAQKDQAYRLIFNRKFAEEMQVWIQELRGDAYIKIIGENK